MVRVGTPFTWRKDVVQEIWAPVDDFPDYAVSNHGRVVNYKYGRELSPRQDSYGYCRVRLYNGSLSQEFFVHHLVGKAFLTGYTSDVSIRHVDENNSNNHVLNLRFKRGRGIGHFRSKHPDVRYRRVRIVETGEVFRTVRDLARWLGNSQPSNIYKVLRGERVAHLGYTFEYVEEQ